MRAIAGVTAHLVLSDEDLGEAALADLATDDKLADDGILRQALPPMRAI